MTHQATTEAVTPDEGGQPGSNEAGSSGTDLFAPRVALPHPLRSRLLKAACMVLDMAAVMLALSVAYFAARHHLVPEARVPDGACIKTAIVSLPVWLAAFVHYRLYGSRFVSSRPNELSRLLHAVASGILGMVTLSFLLHLPTSRSWVVTSFFTAFVICLLERQLVRFGFDTLRKRGLNTREILLVGTNPEAKLIHRQLTLDPRLGYTVVGTVGEDSGHLPELPYLGTTDQALAIALEQGVTGVIVATTAVSSVTTNRLVREFANANMHVELSSALADVGAERLTVRQFGYFPMLYIEPVRVRGWRVAAKRAFDISLALVALILLSPLLVAVAIMVRLDSPGPVIFRQTRVGVREKPFTLFKFRTMVVDAEARLIDLRAQNEADGALFKMQADPRITKVGTWLRRYSLDELPQLANVLFGKMSVVGPRPALFSEMATWTPELRTVKLSVRPGLTGIWQVSGRSNLPFESYVRLDLFYVQNWSLWRDVAIVARTIPVVLKREGAY